MNASLNSAPRSCASPAVGDLPNIIAGLSAAPYRWRCGRHPIQACPAWIDLAGGHGDSGRNAGATRGRESADAGNPSTTIENSTEKIAADAAIEGAASARPARDSTLDRVDGAGARQGPDRQR